ncbi:MAG: SRPBCC domain-containing protein [Candidatus Solibacter sp.]
MKRLLLLLAVSSVVFAQDALKSPAAVKVTKLDSPKALKFEVEVPAKPADVWAAFTTSAGLNTWLWKECTVDLQPGGGWTVHYPGGATGGGTIETIQPGKQLVIHAMAPEKFPEVRRTGTTAVFDFESSGDGTRVTLTQTGWKQGKEWDDAYEYLSGGNAQLLTQLKSRFVNGPVQWDKQ